MLSEKYRKTLRNMPVRISDIARKYPPSLRLIVLETAQPKLRVGQLFLVTYKGGSLGREGAHDVIIPDINVSKVKRPFLRDSRSF